MKVENVVFIELMQVYLLFQITGFWIQQQMNIYVAIFPILLLFIELNLFVLTFQIKPLYLSIMLVMLFLLLNFISQMCYIHLYVS